MKIFRQIEPHHGDHSITTASRALATALSCLPAPRSLCEVGCDDEDYDWLLQWAQRLAAERASRWLIPYGHNTFDGALTMRHPEAIGVLLLLLAAETARREAREGYVWSVFQDKFPYETRKVLFVQGQPARLHKDALEAAAQQLDLRHVFGMEGTQNYYITVYLQFGFTRSAIKQLPLWLAGHPSSGAVHHLLGERSDLTSDSFKLLWRRLRDYRRGNITRERARGALISSPWLLPDWADSILEEATRHVDLTPGATSDGTADETPFMAQPRIDWDSASQPTFTCELTNLAFLDLSAPSYHVLRGSERLATLIRQPDETYVGDDKLELPAETPLHLLTLSDNQGQVLARQMVALWDPKEEITLYELGSSKRIVDPWCDPLNTNHGYVMIAAADLDLSPTPTRWAISDDGEYRFWLLESDWSPTLKLTLEGAPFWTPNLAQKRRPESATPEWARSPVVTAQPSLVRVGEWVGLSIDAIPSGVEIDFVRFRARPLNFSQTGEHASVDAFHLTADLMLDELALTLGLRRGSEHTRVDRTIPIERAGTVRFSGRGWEAVDPDVPLNVHDAATYIYLPRVRRRYMLPAKFAHLALREGQTFSRPLWDKPQPIGRLAGLGAQLRVVDTPYNSTEVLLPLSRAVIAPGIVKGVSWSDEHVCIRLGVPNLEPGPGHSIVIWSFKCSPRLTFASDISHVGPGAWRMDASDFDPDRCAVAVTYEGARLGAHWPQALHGAWLEDVTAPGAALETAALLHWFHLPILQHSYRDAVSEIAQKFPAQILAAWLLDEGLPSGLQPGLAGEEWLGAIRAVFREWNPSAQESRDVLETLATYFPDDPLGAPALLLRLDPLLLRRILRTQSRVSSLPGSDRPLVHDVGRLRRRIAGITDAGSDYEVQVRQKEMLRLAAHVMKVDSNFVDRGIVTRALDHKRELTNVDVGNLRSAMDVRPFREYLGLRALAAL